MSHKDIIDYDAAKATAASDDKAAADENKEIIGVLRQVKQAAERGAKFVRVRALPTDTRDQLAALGFAVTTQASMTEVSWP